MTDETHFDDTTIFVAVANLHIEIGTPSLDAAVTELANARALEESVKAHYSARLDAWKRDNADLLVDLDNAREAVAEAERAVRTATLDAYAQTGSKKPHPAVGVQITKVISYDGENARVWAMTASPVLLKLDAAAFDKAVRAGLVPADIAQVEEVPQATIASDLSAWLESEGE